MEIKVTTHITATMAIPTGTIITVNPKVKRVEEEGVGRGRVLGVGKRVIGVIIVPKHPKVEEEEGGIIVTSTRTLVEAASASQTHHTVTVRTVVREGVGEGRGRVLNAVTQVTGAVTVRKPGPDIDGISRKKLEEISDVRRN